MHEPDKGPADDYADCHDGEDVASEQVFHDESRQLQTGGGTATRRPADNKLVGVQRWRRRRWCTN